MSTTAKLQRDGWASLEANLRIVLHTNRRLSDTEELLLFLVQLLIGDRRLAEQEAVDAASYAASIAAQARGLAKDAGPLERAGLEAMAKQAEKESATGTPYVTAAELEASGTASPEEMRQRVADAKARVENLGRQFVLTPRESAPVNADQSAGGGRNVAGEGRPSSPREAPRASGHGHEKGSTAYPHLAEALADVPARVSFSPPSTVKGPEKPGGNSESSVRRIDGRVYIRFPVEGIEVDTGLPPSLVHAQVDALASRLREAGYLAGLEAAAKLCDPMCSEDPPQECAAAIRELAARGKA